MHGVEVTENYLYIPLQSLSYWGGGGGIYKSPRPSVCPSVQMSPKHNFSFKQILTLHSCSKCPEDVEDNPGLNYLMDDH